MAGMNGRNAGIMGNVNVSSRNSSSFDQKMSGLNQSMSRGGFVKTVGVGMAGLGAVATGFGGVARAQTLPTAIYPTGDPEQDTGIIQAAVNAAPEGGVILLKSVNNGVNYAPEYAPGAPTPWFLKKQRTTEQFVIRPPAPELTTDFYEGMFPPNTGLVIGIDDKTLIIKGEVDRNGAPLTVIKGMENETAYIDTIRSYYQTWDPAYEPSGAFYTTGGKVVRFESLSFKYMASYSATIMSFSNAVEIVNCKFDFTDLTVEVLKDDRYPGSILISDCSFSNFTTWGILLKGCLPSAVIKNCQFRGMSFNCPGAQVFACIFNNTNSVDDYHEQAASMMCTTLKDLTIKDCDFDFTGSHHQPGVAVSAANSYGGLAENVSVQNCRFTGFSPIWGDVLEVAWPSNWDHGFAVPMGVVNKCSAIGNTFTNCSSQDIILLDGNINDRGTGIPTNCLISNNTITTKLGARSGIHVWTAKDTKIQGNNLNGAMAYPILLDGTTEGTVVHGNNITNLDLRYPYISACWPNGPDGNYTRDAQLSEPLMQTVPGVFGSRALDFDGIDGYVNCGNDSSLDIGRTNGFTLSMWINLRTVPNDYDRVLDKAVEGAVAPYSCYGFSFMPGSTNIVASGSSGSIQGYVISNTSLPVDSNVPDANWTHVVSVYDPAGVSGPNGLTLYINSALDATNPAISGLIRTTTASLGIGRNPEMISQWFDGLLDDIAIWDRPLSGTEIAALYSGTAPNDSSLANSLVAYYNCDSLAMNGNIQILPDQSGYGNDGKVNFASCPHEVQYGANVYLAPEAIHNTLRGYSGGKVIDLPGDDGSGKFVMFMDTAGNSMFAYYEFGSVLNWDPTGYKDGNPAEPLTYKYGNELIYDFNSGKEVKLVQTDPMLTLNVGTGTFTIPMPMYYSTSEDQQDWWIYWGGTLNPIPVFDSKYNFITGFEPMKGAGGIGPKVSMPKMGPEMKTWLQSFRGFLQTHPTKEQIRAWMAQNPKPSHTTPRSTGPKKLEGPLGFRGRGPA